MKRFKIVILSILFLAFATQAIAAWTYVVSRVARTQNYIYWKIVCTSDGTDPDAVNILSSTYIDNQFLIELQKSTMLVMDVIPGIGGVQPDETITITMSNSLVQFYTGTGFAYDANTVGNLLSTDYSMFPPVLDKLYIDINDIGSDGDQVTLAILGWIEGGEK